MNIAVEKIWADDFKLDVVRKEKSENPQHEP